MNPQYDEEDQLLVTNLKSKNKKPKIAKLL